MARPRTGDKETDLVEAAVELFLRKGVRGTTVQDIATGADVAVGSVYTYFKDKVAIVRAVAYAFAEKHREFADSVLQSRKEPMAKMRAYILGFYDMWVPFSGNDRGPVELAEFILRHAPETTDLAQNQFVSTIESLLRDAQEKGLHVEKPAEEARYIALSTAAFFPLAGTTRWRPARFTRTDLEGLLRWIERKLR
jgi:AcrR family transcriptional regulator